MDTSLKSLDPLMSATVGFNMRLVYLKSYPTRDCRKLTSPDTHCGPSRVHLTGLGADSQVMRYVEVTSSKMNHRFLIIIL